MRKPDCQHSLKAEMNVVPYIDVMLVLLVIFMVTAPLLIQGVPLDLPQAAAQDIQPDQENLITVSVRADGQYFWHRNQETEQNVSLEQLPGQIQAVLSSPAPVYIRADKGVSYDQVLQAIATLQRHGITQLALVTEVP